MLLSFLQLSQRGFEARLEFRKRLADGATLDDLRFAINDLGAGVTASVINTGTTASPAYRLTLTATASGAANTVSVLTDTTSLDFTNTSGTGATHGAFHLAEA